MGAFELDSGDEEEELVEGVGSDYHENYGHFWTGATCNPDRQCRGITLIHYGIHLVLRLKSGFPWLHGFHPRLFRTQPKLEAGSTRLVAIGTSELEWQADLLDLY